MHPLPPPDSGASFFEFWGLRFRDLGALFSIQGASFSRFRGLRFRDLGASCFGLRFGNYPGYRPYSHSVSYFFLGGFFCCGIVLSRLKVVVDRCGSFQILVTTGIFSRKTDIRLNDRNLLLETGRTFAEFVRYVMM